VRTLIASLIAGFSFLALAGAGTGATSFGVVDDGPKGSLDGGESFFAQLAGLGMTESSVSVRWDAENPTDIQDAEALSRLVAISSLSSIRLVFAVHPAKARAITSSPAAPGQFAQFLRLLATTYPQVKDYIVGNEPNQPRFWQPQFNAKGKGVSCGAYEGLLARSYDALKAVDRAITVIGVGLSPRGNDDPRAVSNVSTSPVRCLRELGAAYRASGRRKPIMDELSFHPYPNSARDGLLKGYKWPNAGVANLDRIKQAVWDAFHGTAQPTFAEGRRTGGLKLRLDEVGWQVGVPSSLRSFYYGRENVETTDEGSQARIYAQLVGYLACDSAVKSVLLFGLKDEPDLDRWQAALLRADGSPRPAFDSVKRAIAQTAGRCPGRLRAWRHSTSVAGASARFSGLGRPKPYYADSWSFLALAEEDASFKAALFRVRGRVPRRAIAQVLRGSWPGAVLSSRGTIEAHSGRIVRFPKRTLRSGTYVYGLLLRAAMNPQRTSVIVSRPFRVLAPRKRG
jgi:hypothetical protein